MHRLLERQLRKCFGDAGPPPSLAAFLELVDAAYHDSDADRRLLEQSMDLVSEELAERYQHLRASEERFRILVEHAADAIFLFDTTGRLIDVNRWACHGLGYSREELLERSIGDIDVALDATHLADLVRASATDEALTLEGVHRRRDGSEFPVESRIGRFDSGGRLLLLAVVRDVTARREAEARLQQSLSLLQATLESTGDGILVVDPAGRVSTYNQRFIDLWSVPPALIDRRSDDALLEYVMDQLVDPHGFLEKIRVLYADPDAESLDVLDLRDGRRFERFSQPQRLDGRSIGRVWSFQDVTRQQQLESELRQAQKLEAIGRLAGGVAHDFNNLLTVIQGNAFVLLEELPEGMDGAELVQIGKAADRAAELTRQLLAFSRQQVLKPRVHVLADVVADVLPMLRRLIGTDIEVDAHPLAGGSVCADAGQLQQVIVNLAVNARDAMPGGGVLRITVAERVVDEEEAEHHPDAQAGPHMVLTVCDTGTGMDRDTQARIFEPFFTTKEQGRGTGLGLATVYGIVTQTGGHVHVSSEPGQGTRFEVLLPSVPEVGEQPAQEDVVPAASGTETVLLVEDDEDVRTLAAQVLRRSGFSVVTARSGEEALGLWDEHGGGFDVLLTDIVMPRMSGLDLADRLRGWAPDLRVLFMTGHTDETKVGNGRRLADVDLIRKPFLPHILTHRLRAALDRFVNGSHVEA